MPEWFVERGIGEDRALLLDGDTPLAAKLRWPGDLITGTIVDAKLVAKTAGSQRGLARSGTGKEILLDRIPAGFSEGADILVLIKRDAVAERGRMKRAHGRVVQDAGAAPRTGHADDPFHTGRTVRRFPQEVWEHVFDAAWTGEVPFSGGSLLFNPTPAMTLIDIDGDRGAETLAQRAVPPIARSLDLLDIGGQVGIDFPSLERRETRQAVDDLLADALRHRKVERTAMNGFGFVQIVSRLEGPSLLQRFAMYRNSAAARLALRRAERVEGAGTTLLTVHPSVAAKLPQKWLAELERRTGRPVRIEHDANLALEASAAQIVGHE